mmetsp:Transcript_135340/g.320779  ORF Transcript_135340/g.320779 Transcript_135340/m.320779 type:complete len:384 (+) Transcript_135340:558-1709(+)
MVQISKSNLAYGAWRCNDSQPDCKDQVSKFTEKPVAQVTQTAQAVIQVSQAIQVPHIPNRGRRSLNVATPADTHTLPATELVVQVQVAQPAQPAQPAERDSATLPGWQRGLWQPLCAAEGNPHGGADWLGQLRHRVARQLPEPPGGGEGQRAQPGAGHVPGTGLPPAAAARTAGLLPRLRLGKGSADSGHGADDRRQPVGPTLRLPEEGDFVLQAARPHGSAGGRRAPVSARAECGPPGPENHERDLGRVPELQDLRLRADAFHGEHPRDGAGPAGLPSLHGPGAARGVLGRPHRTDLGEGGHLAVGLPLSGALLPQDRLLGAVLRHGHHRGAGGQEEAPGRAEGCGPPCAGPHRPVPAHESSRAPGCGHAVRSARALGEHVK